MEEVEIRGLRFRQRNAQKSPKAKERVKWAGVERTEDHVGGVQRSLRRTRLSGIRRFLGADPRNTLPNNILLAFAPHVVQYESLQSQEGFDELCGDNVDVGMIKFNYDPSAAASAMPALVVDGQHRLFGAASFDENVPLVVVAMLDAEQSEQAFQFIVINNKSVKVPTTTVKSIVADYEEIEAGLIERLLPAGITYGKQSSFLVAVGEGENSPFRRMLEWDRNRDGDKVVAVTAIQSMLQYLKNQTELLIENDDDSAQQIFMWIWGGLKELYVDLWDQRNEKFFSKVNLIAMNEYCVDRIRSLASMSRLDLFSKEEIVDAVMTMFENVPGDFWNEHWSVQIQDNKVIRELLKGSFERVAANCIRDKTWSSDVKLFASSD